MKFFRSVLFRVGKVFDSVYCAYLRKVIKNKDFSIISSNCWGGGVYEDLGLQYKTPTVGLFFFAPCYLTFLKNLELYLSSPLNFIEKSRYPEANLARKDNPYPIGLIGNSEIHFIHYKNCKIAEENWNRRAARVNFSNLFISFTDKDNCTIDNLKDFDNLKFENKVVFVAKDIHLKSAVWLKKFNKEGCVGDIYSNRWDYRMYFDVAKWLNTSKTNYDR